MLSGVNSTAEARFRDMFRGHPAGVALITARIDGRQEGMTISSLASVTLEPLAVSFSFSRSGGTAGEMLKASTFLIHFLRDSQADLAVAFADPAAPRFTAEQGWDVLPTGEPYLPAALGAMRVRPLSITEVGDARLVAAEVLNVLEGPAGQPLLYHDRRFLSLAETVPAPGA